VPEEGPYREISIVDTGTASITGIDISAGIINPTVTAETPPRLQIEITNTGQDRYATIDGDNKCTLFDRQDGGSYPAGLWLHPPASLENIQQQNDRFTRDRDPGRQRDYAGYRCPLELLKAGDSIRNEFVVWDDYRTDGYYPTENFQFVDDTEFWNGSEKPNNRATEADETMSWYMTLNVESVV
jgi:hypothetical protein